MTAREIVERANALQHEIEDAGHVEAIEVVYELLGEVARLLGGAIDTLPAAARVDSHVPEATAAAEAARERVPTAEQGLALARFLRPCFQSPRPGERHASVSRGGAGLPDDYLYVQLSDGYVGGIDREGRVST